MRLGRLHGDDVALFSLAVQPAGDNVELVEIALVDMGGGEGVRLCVGFGQPCSEVGSGGNAGESTELATQKTAIDSEELDSEGCT